MWKQFVLTSKKALKKKQYHPENAGNGICETLHFKIFPGDHAPGPPTTHYAARRADEHMPMTSHGMIKFGRANSSNTPPPPAKRW